MRLTNFQQTVYIACIVLTYNMDSARAQNCRPVASNDFAQISSRLSGEFLSTVSPSCNSVVCDDILTTEDFRYYVAQQINGPGQINLFSPFEIWEYKCYLSIKCNRQISAAGTTLLTALNLPATVQFYGYNTVPLWPFSAYYVTLDSCGLLATDLPTVLLMYRQAPERKTFYINLVGNRIGNLSFNSLFYYNNFFQPQSFSSTTATGLRAPVVGVFNLSRNFIQDISQDSPEFYRVQRYRDTGYEERAENINIRYTINSLDLSFNNIGSEWALRSLCNVRNLHSLYLQNNQLTSIGQMLFSCLSNLTTLNISHNFISDIATTAFANTSLAFVDLSNNQLTRINGTMFPSSIRTIILRNNRITAIPSDMLRVLASASVFFDNNPVDCCASLWIANGSLASTGYPSMTCANPANITLALTAQLGCQVPHVVQLAYNASDHVVRCYANGSSLLMNMSIIVANQHNRWLATPVACNVQETASQNNATSELCATIPGDAAAPLPGSGDARLVMTCLAENSFGRNSSQAAIQLAANDVILFTSDFGWRSRTFSIGELVGAIIAVFVLTLLLAAILLYVVVRRMRKLAEQDKAAEAKQQAIRDDRRHAMHQHVHQHHEPHLTIAKSSMAESNNTTATTLKGDNSKRSSSATEWEAYMVSDESALGLSEHDDGTGSWVDLPTLPIPHKIQQQQQQPPHQQQHPHQPQSHQQNEQHQHQKQPRQHEQKPVGRHGDKLDKTYHRASIHKQIGHTNPGYQLTLDMSDGESHYSPVARI